VKIYIKKDFLHQNSKNIQQKEIFAVEVFTVGLGLICPLFRTFRIERGLADAKNFFIKEYYLLKYIVYR